MQPETRTGLSVGALREALISAMDRGGAWGSNLHESKNALVRVGDDYWLLGQVAVDFRNGRFVLVLKASYPDVLR